MLTHTHWLKKIWEDMYLPFYLIPQELAVCSCNSWQHSLNCTVGASDRSSMPQGIVWFKILLCCKSQQMVVGFFEVDFYSSRTFKQLPPLLLTSSSMQLSGKKCENEQRKVDFFLFVLQFQGKGHRTFSFLFSWCWTWLFASTRTALLYYPDQGNVTSVQVGS